MNTELSTRQHVKSLVFCYVVKDNWRLGGFKFINGLRGFRS